MDPTITPQIAEARKQAAEAAAANARPDAYWLDLISDTAMKARGQSEERFQRACVKIAGIALAALDAHAGQ